jgi:hypothetical protein
MQIAAAPTANEPHPMSLMGPPSRPSSLEDHDARTIIGERLGDGLGRADQRL